MRLLSQDTYSKIKKLQDAKLSAKAAAAILGISITTVKKVYQVASYDEYTRHEMPVQQTAPSEQIAGFDQVATVMNNIATELTEIRESLERLEAMHETKFSFFKGR